MSSVVLVPPCYSNDSSIDPAIPVAGTQIPCDPNVPWCVDNNGTPCAAANPNAVQNALAIVDASPAASNASTTGALSASRTGGGASGASGPSLTALFASLATTGATAYQASQAPAPKSNVRVGTSGVAIPGGSAGSLLLVGAVVIALGFLFFAGKHKVTK